MKKVVTKYGEYFTPDTRETIRIPISIKGKKIPTFYIEARALPSGDGFNIRALGGQIKITPHVSNEVSVCWDKDEYARDLRAMKKAQKAGKKNGKSK